MKAVHQVVRAVRQKMRADHQRMTGAVLVRQEAMRAVHPKTMMADHRVVKAIRQEVKQLGSDSQNSNHKPSDLSELGELSY